MILLQRQWQKLLEFLFPAETDAWLAVFRVGVGLQVVVYALFLRRDWHSLFSTTGKGLVSRELGEAIASFDSPLIPKLGWLVAFGQLIGLGEGTVLSIAWACLLCMGCCLLVGLFCRPAAIIAWFLHLCAAESGALLAYGVFSSRARQQSRPARSRAAAGISFHFGRKRSRQADAAL